MTRLLSFYGKRKIFGKRLQSILMLMLTSAVIVLFPLRSEQLGEWVRESLVFCYRTVIPGVFPFMVASNLLAFCISDVGFISRRQGAAGRLLGCGGAVLPTFLIGAFAGFPVGAKNICALYGAGQCEKEEAERMLGVCSNAGLGFCVAVLGGGMWGDKAFGLKVWAITLVSSLIVGVLLAPRGNNSGNKTYIERAEEKGGSVGKAVTEAVADSAVSVLKVCGFVTVFGLVGRAAASFTEILGVNAVMGGAISSLLEFSSGCAKLSLLADSETLIGAFDAVKTAKTLSVLAMAHSGISVHFQVSAFAFPQGLSMKKYYVTKLLVSIVSAVIAAFLCVFGAL